MPNGHLVAQGRRLNRTQLIVRDWIMQSNLQGDALLLEALLGRGFLAFRDNQGIWLGTGSHEADLFVLQQVDGLAIEHVSGDTEKMAAVHVQYIDTDRVMEIATGIISIPEHHVGDSMGNWTTFGPRPFLPSGWGTYRNMAWGAKLAVCPRDAAGGSTVQGALDIGIALLVKALPLARIATSLSCDGHGTCPAHISFHYPWDAIWGKAVFQAVRAQTANSKWLWDDQRLSIRPIGEFCDAGVLGMLHDIQGFARRLLNRNVINHIGIARERTLIASGVHPPGPQRYAEIGMRELARAELHSLSEGNC